MTFSAPTTRAYCTMRSATSSGCSTKFEVESITPGMMILPSGSFTSFHTFHSWPWRGFAPGNDSAWGRPLGTVSAMSFSGTSLLWGPWVQAPPKCLPHAHALGRNVLDRVVERVDVGGDHLAELLEAQMGEHHVPAERQVRTVELQHQAGVHDGAVFARHHVGERVEIGFLAPVVLVLEVTRDLPRRRRREGDVRRVGAGGRRLRQRDVGLERGKILPLDRARAGRPMLERRGEIGEHRRELGEVGLAGAERRGTRAIEASEAVLDVGGVIGAA